MSKLNGRPGSATRVQVQRHTAQRLQQKSDWVVTEEPLEIRLLHHTPTGLNSFSLSVTLRTPGQDFELAAGFLFSEGIVQGARDIETMAYCLDEEAQHYNIVNVQLGREVSFDPQGLQRHFYTTSSCGVCGKASLEALQVTGCAPLADGFSVSADLVKRLPQALRNEQDLFERTGGLHAAGLFDAQGSLQTLREDVGRHNAVDKVIGHALTQRLVPLHQRVLALSGRAGFELLQKALRAQIPVVASVGAPSSMAVELARAFNVTLLGFVSETRFNVYSGAQRLA